jgi:hypothetical protein
MTRPPVNIDVISPESLDRVTIAEVNHFGSAVDAEEECRPSENDDATCAEATASRSPAPWEESFIPKDRIDARPSC